MTKASAKTKKITATLVAERVTKGAVRFMEETSDFPLNIYLRKEQCDTLGVKAEEGETITLTIEAA